ncbi:ABC transporter substrate-binding protein [Pontibacillus sp. HMF3514]|uniref:ABC transporter substrate-binding protein n=1 Tax=Pontibacillus sp. HMF3514 TaxID=2692425 RepID=UPI00131F8F8F|nr:ABC transporter substrate-binding protein [Pontibacillus sp. HMF3514]QHE51199.1 ABC transporter substrate-binding protein [Pontibacillus sp. HMF3514]
MKKQVVLLISALMLVVLAACGSSEDASGEGSATITFGDAGWDSIRVHNFIAGTIIKEGYGHEMEVTSGSTPATTQGLREGDIDIMMEMWTDNIIEVYNEAIEKEEIMELSVNFDDNAQGFWVPTYVIEGDEERGIEPMAPDLKTVKDLGKYPELFEDPEDPGKGRVIGAPSGWAVDEILATKMKTYGIDDKINYFRPGSDAAIVTSLSDAYESGEPWVGYYWSPTWVTGMYDLTLLDEPDYDKETFEENRGTEIPPNRVTVAVNSGMKDKAPKVLEFLRNYETSSELTAEALTYMKENDASEEEAAKWWLKQHEDLWTEWVPEDVAKKVKDSL